MILLIRHAEKSLIGKHNLTNQGLDDALNYGKNLKQKGLYFDEVISSPVRRCMQTAEKIIKGLDSTVKIQKSHLLGDPGIFVDDDKKAATAFNKFTVCEVINIIIKKEGLTGFIQIDKACRPMIDEILIKITLNKSILYVSHDAIIMPFIAYISEGKVIHESEIINYLGGYVLEKSHNKGLHLTAKSVVSLSLTNPFVGR